MRCASYDQGVERMWLSCELDVQRHEQSPELFGVHRCGRGGHVSPRVVRVMK